MPPEQELIQQWLTRAHEDLRAAAVDVATEPPLIDDACFHCQQAVEKSLKAFLVSSQVEFERSHDLDYLLDLCVDLDVSFEQWRHSGDPLTDYAVRFHYPYAGSPPTLEQFREAQEIAEKIYRFVLDRLPRDTHPSSESSMS